MLLFKRLYITYAKARYQRSANNYETCVTSILGQLIIGIFKEKEENLIQNTHSIIQRPKGKAS